jgi:hypothetical protein
MSAGNAERSHERFGGRTVGVATLHGKEHVIGPALMRALPFASIKPIVGVDTDRFGAFSGEVQRIHDPLTTAKQKAVHGAEVSGMDMVIASEGSFGPYPLAPFISCNEEFLVLYDARDDTFFHHRHLSLKTVFGAERCTSRSEVMAFAGRMKFPEHHLVLRVKEKWSHGDALHKGVADPDRLQVLSEALIKKHGACWVETDMRAMANPTRMLVIAEAAKRFAEEIAMSCPGCGELWFRITEAVSGLPCDLCNWPTKSVRFYRRTCRACGAQADEARPDGKVTEEATYCDNCNP